MRTHRIAGIAVAALSLGSTLAWAADTSMNQKAQPGQATQARYPIAGIVTSVDKMGHKVSIVTPTGKATEVQQLGQNILIESDVNFQALNGPVALDTRILRDGKNATFNDLKEGDVVRAAYDPTTQTFSNIRAVSSSEVKNNPNQASLDLKNPGPMGGQQPGSPTNQ